MNTARRPNLLRSTTILAAVFGILIVGSAYLKARHLRDVAKDVHALGPDFELPRAAFSRDQALADPGCEDEEARSELMAAMAEYAHGRDDAAQRGLLAAVAADPEWVRARFYLGVVRLHLGFPVSAAEDLRRAHTAGFEPEGDSSAWWLAVAELYCGRTERGEPLLREVADGESARASASREILDRLRNIDEEKE